MKSVIKLLFAFALMIHLGACTSNEPTETAEAGDMAEGSTMEMADATAGDIAGDTAADTSTTDEFSEDFADFDESAPMDDMAAADGDMASEPMDDMGAEPMAEGDAMAATDDMGAGTTDDLAAAAETAETTTDDALADLGSDDWSTTSDTTEAPATDELAGLGSDSLADTSSTDSMDSTDSMAGMDSMGSMDDSTASYKPLNKMITTPYKKAGVWVNAIYIARDGDSLDSVAQKIYGSSAKADELRSINGHLASRDVVVGDKIYYNSPQRPDDNTSVKVFYEDIGLNPEYYVAQAGDSIRAVGKKLLGNSKSWKELYATNLDVETKDILDEGTNLRYWAGDFSAPPAPPAQASTSTPPPMEEPPVEDVPPPMPDEPELAQNDMPAEMPAPEMAEEPASAGTIQEPPQQAFTPPPPPPVINAPPPKPVAQNSATDAMGLGDDTTALIAGAILLLAAVAMLVIIRKRKAKKAIEFHTATHTQID